ncbi:MAG: hypothetical protein F4047_05465 [Caldilineaceae bacterium SB0670_bin_27]|uniref:DUF7847 domain-containing protein n=1 Tax=Caldilineaceae bacterium SB0664_bin_27 TaxID=2605260 RepID=A0A6B0YT87_9CHLR|nr:hypothetical protein [Caldilineaceae bacterium SB0664_bin_27]MYJ77599.1 hypothetical protein [Caldilineaceae bacterium SB0670_bin_27]
MQTSITPTSLTFGKLLGLAFGLYRAQCSIFLRTASLFYVPIAALSLFFVENEVSNLLFGIVVWPVGALVNLSLIAHCVDALHGRPLAVRTAVGRGLRRLPADIGLILATMAVMGGIAAVAMIPSWVGLLNADIPFDEIRHAFLDLVSGGDVEGVNNLLGDALWGSFGFCLSSVLILIVFSYLSVRWLIAEVALMTEETGPLESLRRGWNLSRDFVLRTYGYLILISIATVLVGGLFSALENFVLLPLFPAVDQSWKTGIGYAVSQLSSIITTPFYVIAIVLYYFDLRVRREKYSFGIVQE